MVIDGALNNDGFTALLRSQDSGDTVRETFCVKFDARDLPKIAGNPGQANRFCNIHVGETSEGLPCVIESHRCYPSDPQGNNIARKV